MSTVTDTVEKYLTEKYNDSFTFDSYGNNSILYDKDNSHGTERSGKRYQCIQNETDSNYDFCAVFKCRYSDYADTADQPNHE